MEGEYKTFFKVKLQIPDISLSDWEKMDIDKYDFETSEEKKPTLAELHQNFMKNVNEFIKNQKIPE